MHDQLNTKFVLIAGLLTGLMFFVWGFAIHMSPLQNWAFHLFKNGSALEEIVQKHIDSNGAHFSMGGLFCHVALDKDIPNREVLLSQNLMFTLLSDLATGVLLAAFFDLFVQPRHVKEGAIAGAFLAATHFLSETLESIVWYRFSPRFAVFETVDSLNLVAAGILLTVLASKIHSGGGGSSVGSSSYGTPSSSGRSAPGSSRKKRA